MKVCQMYMKPLLGRILIILQDVCSRVVQGLGTVTFRDVFDELKQRGIPVFIIGGAVRDAVVGVTTIKGMSLP